MFDNVNYKSHTLGYILREARQQAGYSLRKLAEISGVSASQIHNIETNKYDVSLENYLRICLSLGVPPGLPLEDSLYPLFSFYADDIEGGEKPECFTAEEWKDPQFKNLASSFMGICAATYQHLLSISYPIVFCERIEYPASKMEARFKEIAKEIHHYNSLERLNDSMALKQYPVQVLQSKELVFPEYIRSLCEKYEIEGDAELWLPFFREDSIKLIR